MEHDMRQNNLLEHPRRLGVIAMLVPLFAFGCDTPTEKNKSTVDLPQDLVQEIDRQSARQPFEDQARRGVQRQRTLFSYHFEPESAALTSLARRDLQYLLESVRDGGARVSVRRVDASPELYAARVTMVRDWFLGRGVEASRIIIDDSPPGGPGVSSVEAIAIRAEIKLVPFKVPSGTILTPLAGREEN
jgi:hypothetical protein